MKQIFDWLREQISKESWLSKPRTKGHYSDDAVFVEDAMNIINEAEAKWESDCCEWKQEKCLEFSLSDCVTSCGHAEHYSTGIDKYCRHCGKHIKISEVE